VEGIEFDVDTLYTIALKWHKIANEQIDLYKQGKWEEARKVGQTMIPHQNKVNEMVYPIYLEMLALGYTRIDLISEP